MSSRSHCVATITVVYWLLASRRNDHSVTYYVQLQLLSQLNQLDASQANTQQIVGLSMLAVGVKAADLCPRGSGCKN